MFKKIWNRFFSFLYPVRKPKGAALQKVEFTFQDEDILKLLRLKDKFDKTNSMIDRYKMWSFIVEKYPVVKRTALNGVSWTFDTSSVFKPVVRGEYR